MDRNFLLISIIVLTSIFIIVLTVIFLTKKEKYDGKYPIKNYKLMAASGDAIFNINPLIANAISISGFKPNSWVILSFNDSESQFPVDEKGVVHWNGEKEALPLYLAPYEEKRIVNIKGPTAPLGGGFYDEIASEPVAQYYDIPPDEPRIPLTRKVEIPVDLVYIDPNTSKLGKSRRTATFLNGSVDISSPFVPY